MFCVVLFSVCRNFIDGVVSVTVWLALEGGKMERGFLLFRWHRKKNPPWCCVVSPLWVAVAPPTLHRRIHRLRVARTSILFMTSSVDSAPSLFLPGWEIFLSLPSLPNPSYRDPLVMALALGKFVPQKVACRLRM